MLININKKEFKKACTFSLVILLIFGVGYITLEPSLTKASATANSAVNVNLTVDPTMAITTPSTVTMSPNITGTGTSTGSQCFDHAGYDQRLQQLCQLYRSSDWYAGHLEHCRH